MIDNLWRKRERLDIVKLAGNNEQLFELLKLYLEEIPWLKNQMITNKPLNEGEYSGYFTSTRAGVSSDNFKWFNVPFWFSEDYFYTRVFPHRDNVRKLNNYHQYYFDSYQLFKDEAFEQYSDESSVLAQELNSCLENNDLSLGNIKQQLPKFAYVSCNSIFLNFFFNILFHLDS